MDNAALTAEENLGLVHACAKRFKGRGIEYDDLFQAGCLGLIKAAERFDSGLGYKFSTYAVPVILGEIRRLFRDGGSVKISRSLKELSMKVSQAAQEWQRTKGREPTVSELAEALSLSPEQVAEALNASRQPISLTADDEEQGGQTDIPVPSPDEAVTDSIALHTELDRLPEKDRTLIILRFFKGLTQSKTAARLGMTQVQVSRREKKLLMLLRERLT